ncbi:MAG TPA: peptidylprolyl isomerase [Flavobacteriales bacterium]|nr:peptidylprolyl isomerase [Flavobacteriales bacterium]
MLLLLGALGTRTYAQAAPAPRQTLVEIRTEMGMIVVALYNETPQHRDNFLKLVREHAYDSLLFHRVVAGLMVQGGDPDSKHAAEGASLGKGGPGYTLAPEILPTLIHKRGALAAVREPDDVNPERRSNGSQFYIVQGKTYPAADLEAVVQRNARYGTTVRYTEAQRRTYASDGGTPHMDGAYTIFGEVLEGMDVVEAIAALPSNAQYRPLKDIRMFMHIMQ